MKRKRNYSLFEDKSWAFRHFDGRRREFRGWGREEFYAAQEKHWKRAGIRRSRTKPTIYEYRRKMISIFAEIPYECHRGPYRRHSDGFLMYLATLPGRIRQVSTDDPILVAYLTKKFNKHFGNK